MAWADYFRNIQTMINMLLTGTTEAGSAIPGRTTAGLFQTVNTVNSGVDIGDVTINNTAGSGAYVQPGTSTVWGTSEVWRAALAVEEAADDSDKTFMVTAGQEWQLQSIWVELTSTADVGNRQMSVQIQDSEGDVIGCIKAGVAQAASLTYNYLFGVGVSDLTAVRSSTFLMTPLVPWILPAGYKVRVYDSAAVAAAADDMVVQILYAYRTV